MGNCSGWFFLHRRRAEFIQSQCAKNFGNEIFLIQIFCFFAIRPNQMPDAMKTRLQPAVNQTRNGTGR
jgi:hypothetical protein